MFITIVLGSFAALVAGVTFVGFAVGQAIRRRFSPAMLSFLLGIAILTFECMTAAAIYQEDGALIDRKVTYWEIRHGF